MTGPLRLPGSVAEVDASPPGPGIGAFFDLDGTLVAGFTVAAVTRDRLRHREVGAAEFLQMMQLAVEYRLGRHQFENVIAAAVRTTKGRLAEDVDEVGERIFRQSVVDLIYPEMRELVRAHQRRGHTVVLSSSALTMQAEPVARYLGIDHVVCNRFVVDEHGVLTGEVQRPVIWGTSKATSVQKFAAEHGVDLRSSYFYADGDEDLALMHLVGNPRPVNPGPELTKVAERRGQFIRYTLNTSVLDDVMHFCIAHADRRTRSATRWRASVRRCRHWSSARAARRWRSPSAKSMCSAPAGTSRAR